MRLPAAIPVRFSPRLAALLTAAHGAALTALWLCAPDIVPGLALTAAISFSLGLNLHRLQHGRVARLLLDARGALRIERPGGDMIEARVLPATTVLAGLVVLLFDAGGRREALTLLPDATGHEAHRQLRLWLRWRAATA